MSSLEPRPSVVGAAADVSESGASEKPTSVDEGMLSPGLAAVLEEAASQLGRADNTFGWKPAVHRNYMWAWQGSQGMCAVSMHSIRSAGKPAVHRNYMWAWQASQGMCAVSMHSIRSAGKPAVHRNYMWAWQASQGMCAISMHRNGPRLVMKVPLTAPGPAQPRNSKFRREINRMSSPCLVEGVSAILDIDD
jgi:hypothetical protein